MSNNLQTITSKLWAMANELRGTMDASNDFEKCKNQNNLNYENIDKIINTFKERKDALKYNMLMWHQSRKSRKMILT